MTAPAKRRPGRPSLSDAPTERVTVRLPAPTVDDARAAAEAAGEDLSDVIRAGLDRELAARKRAAKRVG